MRALIQRVNEASVLVDGEVVGAIGMTHVFSLASRDDLQSEDGEQDLEPQGFRMKTENE